MKLLGRLGWRGQCSCCNGPKDRKAIRAEEKRAWRGDVGLSVVPGVAPPRPSPGGVPPDFED